MEDCLYFRAEWRPEESIGRGHFASVYTLRENGSYVIKVSRIIEEDLYFPEVSLSTFNTRVDIQNRLAKMGYSIDVVDSWECNGEYGVIVMKRLKQTLKSYLVGKSPEIILLTLSNLYKLVHGIHKLGITHGDLKLENIMVDDGKLYLIDFDYSRLTKEKDLINQDLLQLEQMTSVILENL